MCVESQTQRTGNLDHNCEAWVSIGAECEVQALAAKSGILGDPLRAVDAIAGPEVDLELRHSALQVSVIAGVPVNQTINSHKDTSATGRIP